MPGSLHRDVHADALDHRADDNGAVRDDDLHGGRRELPDRDDDGDGGGRQRCFIHCHGDVCELL